MKRTFATAILTLAAGFGFAQEMTIPSIPVDMKVSDNQSNSYTYFRLQMADQEINNKKPAILPGVGAGYRYSINEASALDVSGNYSGQFDTDKDYMYDAGANYVRYAAPKAQNSFYYGAGLAWGGMQKAGSVKVKVKDAAVTVSGVSVAPADKSANAVDTKKEAASVTTTDAIDFQGLVPSATVGYEMGRNEMIKTFVELKVGQPAVRINSKEVTFKDLPRPVAQFSVGLGF